jgi:hypothetical protein
VRLRFAVKHVTIAQTPTARVTVPAEGAMTSLLRHAREWKMQQTRVFDPRNENVGAEHVINDETISNSCLQIRRCRSPQPAIDSWHGSPVPPENRSRIASAHEQSRGQSRYQLLAAEERCSDLGHGCIACRDLAFYLFRQGAFAARREILSRAARLRSAQPFVKGLCVPSLRPFPPQF